MTANKLHIIHTNDFHSHFASWPQVVKVIKQLKEDFESKQEPYLLLDIGDHMDRSHYITEGTLGQANVALLNHLGYNYVTIGNNEGITFAKEQLSKMYKNASFNVVLGNLLEENGEQPDWLSRYAVHELNGWKIGIMGVTANFALFYQLLGWMSIDPVEVLKKHIAELKNKVDLLILMSHLGLPRDEQIAGQRMGIDIIIGAHTHHVLTNGKMINGSYINQAGKFGRYVGHIVVEKNSPERESLASHNKISPDDSAYILKSREPSTNMFKGNQTGYRISSACLSTENIPNDQEAVSILDEWELVARSSLSRAITVLEHQLNIDWHNESELGNLLAESLRMWCDTEVALVNTGQILSHLKQGVLTFEQLLHICPHPINPCIIQLTGHELWSILQHSLKKEVEELHIVGFGFRGKIMGTMAVDGLQIETKTRREQRIITNIYVNGVPVEKEESYKVASIDMFTFSNIFPEFKKAEGLTYLVPEFIRDLLASRLSKGQFSSAYKKRWLSSEQMGGV